MGSEWNVLKILLWAGLEYYSKSMKNSKTVSFFLIWKDSCVPTWNRHWTEQQCAMWVHHGNNLPVLTLRCSLFLQRFLFCHRASLKVGCSVSWHPIQSDWCTSVLLYLGRSETRHPSHTRLYLPSEDSVGILVNTSSFWQPSLSILHYHASSMPFALDIGHLLHRSQQDFVFSYLKANAILT